MVSTWQLTWSYYLSQTTAPSGYSKFNYSVVRTLYLYNSALKEHAAHKCNTLQKKEVWAQLFVSAKCFKICHNYRKRKPTSFFRFDIEQGIYKVKLKVALNEKRKKIHGFSFSINMANFEAFWGVKKLSANLSFLKCELLISQKVWKSKLFSRKNSRYLWFLFLLLNFYYIYS